MNNIIVYKLGETKRPNNISKQKLLLKLYSLPFLNKIGRIKNYYVRHIIYQLALL